MDKNLVQNLAYMNLFFNVRVLNRGPSVFDFTGKALYPTNIEISGLHYDGEVVHNLAIQAKREGRYASAVGLYFLLLSACFIQYGKIPIELMRGYIKILFAINEYWTAFFLLATLLADMQSSFGVDYQIASLLQTDYNTLMNDSIAYIDLGQYYMKTHMLTVGFSGANNYEFVKTESEIKKELQRIRDKVREIYGK